MKKFLVSTSSPPSLVFLRANVNSVHCMGRDWVYCPVCKKMVGDQGQECQHLDNYFGANDGDFWTFCKEHYKVFPDLTDREAEYLHDNTGRMFNLDPPFDGKKCPVYNCSYWVDMNQVLNEVRTQPDKDIIELERVGYHPFGEGAHPRWILPGQEKYIEMQRAMTERMKKHQQLG